MHTFGSQFRYDGIEMNFSASSFGPYGKVCVSDSLVVGDLENS